MIKKSRGPKGPSVLPRSAQDKEGRPKRGPAPRSGAGRDDARPARPASKFTRDGARPARPSGPRRDDARPGRPAGPRRDDTRSARPSGPRREGDRPYSARPAGPRRDAGSTARPTARPTARYQRDDARPARPSGPRRDDARPARPSGPRREGEGSYSPRPRRDEGAPARPTSRYQRDDARPARPSGPRRDDARSARPSGPRREGDRPSTPRSRPDGERPYRPRAAGDAPRTGRPASKFTRDGARPVRPAGPRREGERPYAPRTSAPRDDRRKSFDRGDRPARPAGARPTGARSTGAPPRSFAGARPAGGARPTSGGRPERPGAARPGAPRAGAGRGYRPRDDFDSAREGRRFARPQRFDAKTGLAIADDAPRPKREKVGQAGGAPSAATPKRGPNVRDLALQVLFQVQVKRAFAERIIEDLAEQMKLDRRDRGFMNELVKGTLRQRATLDWQLNRFMHVGLNSTPAWIQNALRLGAYQLIHLDRIPPRAAVDETVKLALKYGHPGTAGLANSVLRRIAEAVSVGDLSLPSPTKEDGSPDYDAMVAITSHPRWLLERWVPRYGIEGTLALCEANNRHAHLGLRANRLRLDRKELLKRLEEAGLKGTPGKYCDHTVWVEADADFADFPSYARGDCTVQDESETLVSLLAAPKSGERVLDLCAAPGGKSTHLAEMMGDTGEIVAVEKMAPRARTMGKQIARLGLKSVKVEIADGTSANLLLLGAGGMYDRAVVDAPCSGLGVLARRADARWRKQSSLFEEMTGTQAALLRAAAEVVKPGGVIVYSVCSFEPEETDEIIASFLAGNPEWRKDHAAAFLPKDTVEEGGSMRVLPHVHGIDGAFAARLVRSSRPDGE